MRRGDLSILNIINQSDAFIDHFENGATFGESFLANWNPIFFDFQILFLLLLLIGIWGIREQYFYQVKFKFYEKYRGNTEKFRNRKS
mgnify:CR=1 FL=1